jgi:hypothetical protein
MSGEVEQSRRMRRGWLILVGVLLCALGWWLWRHQPSRRAPIAPAATRPAKAREAAPRPLRLPTGEAEPMAEGPGAAGCVVEGRVLSTRTGAGVAHANLTFGGGGAVFPVAANESGQFHWSIAGEGVYQLTSAAAAGYLPFAPTLDDSPVELTARRGVRLSGITIFLSPAVDYLGLVVDGRGQPIPGARVARLEPLEGEPSELSSNTTGEFHFRAPDDAAFEVSAAGHLSRVARLDLAAQVSHRLMVMLPDGAAPPASPQPIVGRVLDEKQAPVDQAQVTAYDGAIPLAQATSDGEGSFALEVRAARVRLVAAHRGFVSATREPVAAGARDVLLQLSHGGRITGTVREKQSGKPVVAFSIVATERRGALERGETLTRSFFDSEGRFALAGVKPGSWYVAAVADGRGAAPEQRVEVSAGADGQCHFSLPGGARLTGKVVDRDSRRGLAGARVSLENPWGADTGVPMPVVASAETNAGGDFVLTGLSEGAVSLFAAAEGHHNRVLPGIRIGDEAPLTIDLIATQPGESPQIESAGINAAVSAQGDLLVLGHISPNGGAAAAGLQEGDVILRVDGTDVSELGFPGAVAHLRGPEGTTVEVTIRRGDAVSDVAVPRKRVINR